jgi:hypothetical protein
VNQRVVPHFDRKRSDFGELPSGLSLRVEDSRVAWGAARGGFEKQSARLAGVRLLAGLWTIHYS